MKCVRKATLIVILVFSAFPATALAATLECLARPALTADTTKSEWADFVSKRLPPLKCPDSKQAWDAKASRLRRKMLDEIVFHGVPKSWYSGPVRVEWVGDVDTGNGYRIRKLRYEAAPGMWIPALLYEPAGLSGNAPAVLTVNGHVGDPGKANESEQIRRIVLAKRGVIALHPEWISFGELTHAENSHNNLACLNLCGVSGLSVFYLAMKRGLDVLAEYPAVDTNCIAMTGLSGGGWQTILLSSLDTRIAVAAPNAGYSGIDMRVKYSSDIGDLEQVPPDLLTVADFSHLTAMLAPRPTLLIYNAKDECCFKADHMAPSVFDPVVPFYQLYDCADLFRMHINEDPGTHNYDRDNRLQLYAVLSETFGLGWDNSEPSWEGEIKTFDELKVGIPENNATLVTLAEPFLADLPMNPAPKDGDRALTTWRKKATKRLRNVIRLKDFPAAVAEKKDESTIEDVRCTTYVLKTGEWSAPAVVLEHAGGKSEMTTILFGDSGKASLGDAATKLVESGSRVVAVDLVLQGECLLSESNHYQFAALIETTGERVLGQNVAQIGSIADWAREEFGAPIAIYSKGWVSGVAALMYSGLHQEDLQKLTLEDAPTSLKDLVIQRVPYKDFHTLFCFGLLREFDISDLTAMCKGTRINLTRADKT